MMWLLLAFLSAALLGFYYVFKKQSLKDNAVIPVLFLNTLFSSLIFLPFIVLSVWRPGILEDSIFYVPVAGWEVHRYVVLKSVIVLSSWILGYFGMKNLPITIVGPINATRPVMVLVGALVVFGERLNFYQWIGVLMAVFSFFMLSRSGKKEGIDFKHNKWIYYVVMAAVLGAVSGLYDKYLMAPVDQGGIGLDRMIVQSWYNIYQLFMMGGVLGILETMWVWNDYLLPYLTLDSTKYKTIPILIQYFRGGYGHVELGPMMACIMMVVIPIVIMYILCQKYIIDGVVAGAVKG